MGFFVLFVLWYHLIGKQNPKIYRAIEGKLSSLFFLILMFSIITSFLPGIKVIALGLLALILVALPVLIPAFLIWFLITRSGKKGKPGKKTVKEGLPSQSLTRSVPKRRKIVKKFSEKNRLNLTDKEIDRIVDASYMSYFWEKEIYEMSLSYDSIYEWYNGSTAWLRAYFRVFPIQDVSSDYNRQKEICLNAFDQIFREVNPERYSSIDECIEAINNRYLTSFDENTFMIAYRFLQSSGKNYHLPSMTVVHTQSELEELMNKYDKEKTQGREKGDIQGMKI